MQESGRRSRRPYRRGCRGGVRRRPQLRFVERQIAASFDATVVSTAAERELLRRIAPEAATRITTVANGVDSDYFSPERPYDAPPEMQGTSLVFVGTMDYRPNVEAAVYFAREILPLVRERLADARFVVVGAKPAAAVKELARSTHVVVTGRVPDVRPYLAHAKVVVAPLQIARGVQNKVLEAMAMAKPVVASPQAVAGIDVQAGQEILVAGDPRSFAGAIEHAISSEAGDAIGRNARRPRRRRSCVVGELGASRRDSRCPARTIVTRNRSCTSLRPGLRSHAADNPNGGRREFARDCGLEIAFSADAFCRFPNSASPVGQDVRQYRLQFAALPRFSKQQPVMGCLAVEQEHRRVARAVHDLDARVRLYRQTRQFRPVDVSPRQNVGEQQVDQRLSLQGDEGALAICGGNDPAAQRREDAGRDGRCLLVLVHDQRGRDIA
jgi:hypothetical protein